jgi:hypothetical protein
LNCSLLGIAYGRSMQRIFWLGFAILGWSYLLLLFIPFLYENVGQHLLAPNLFAYLEGVLHADAQVGGLQSVSLGMLAAAATGGGFGGPVIIDTISDCVRIGIGIEALLWATLGGYAACYFASVRDPAGREGQI